MGAGRSGAGIALFPLAANRRHVVWQALQEAGNQALKEWLGSTRFEVSQ